MFIEILANMTQVSDVAPGPLVIFRMVITYMYDSFLYKWVPENSFINRKLSEYENRMTLLGQELERVNNNLRMKVDENSSLEVKVRGLTQDNE